VIGQQENKLAQFAERDPTLAPLARLQLAALRSAEEPGWERGVPSFGTQQLVAGRPLLHEQTLAVDTGLVTRLWQRLAAMLPPDDADSTGLSAIPQADGVDPLVAVAASINGDAKRLHELAARLGVDAGLVATLAQLTALPLLLACGRHAASVVSAVTWDVGFCPVCAAWPTLAELRGLERERWLRCGRCASAWRYRRLACVYCGNTEVARQGYLAAEAEREARRAETCQICSGYLKSFAALGPMTIAELLAADLATIELDVTALDQGFARPERSAFALQLKLEPLPRGKGWRPWSR
jgi:FdhE protein